jgi:hypothetical protein
VLETTAGPFAWELAAERETSVTLVLTTGVTEAMVGAGCMRVTEAVGTETPGTVTGGAETGEGPNGKEAAPAGRARAVRITNPRTTPAIPPSRTARDRMIPCGFVLTPEATIAGSVCSTDLNIPPIVGYQPL